MSLFASSRAPLMMDVVALSILLVVPALVVSLWRVRGRRDFTGHKRIQVAISIALAVVVGLFEVEVRTHPWIDAARPSSLYETWLFPIFYVHLTVAVSTTVLWTVTVATALRRFPKPPAPAAFSRTHRRLGRAAAIGMACTAVTGWTFYWAAFLA